MPRELVAVRAVQLRSVISRTVRSSIVPAALPDIIHKTLARQMSRANIHGNMPVINVRRLPDINACLAQYKPGQRA